jgi:hypothetical protein
VALADVFGIEIGAPAAATDIAAPTAAGKALAKPTEAPAPPAPSAPKAHGGRRHGRGRIGSRSAGRPITAARRSRRPSR